LEEIKMKKVLSLVLVLALAISLVACGGAKNDNVLTMATNAEFPPYEFMEGGKIAGIDAEIGAAIAAKLGKELVIENVDFDSLIPGVQTNKYDFVMAGMTVTDERKEQVNFSQTYATGVQVIIVKEDSKITSVDDLFAEGNEDVDPEMRELYRMAKRGGAAGEYQVPAVESAHQEETVPEEDGEQPVSGDSSEESHMSREAEAAYLEAMEIEAMAADEKDGADPRPTSDAGREGGDPYEE
jgi:ABC-type amino acid transport substrate-binding protein